MRQPMKKLTDVRMINDFACLPTNMEICKNFEDALIIFKKQFKYMRNSLDVFGVYGTLSLSTNLPFIIPKFGIDWISDKYTMIFSNLNACKIPWVMNGSEQLGVFYLVPSLGKICCGVSMITVGSHTGLGCFSDDSFIKYPQEIIDIFQRKTKETLNKSLE